MQDDSTRIFFFILFLSLSFPHPRTEVGVNACLDGGREREGEREKRWFPPVCGVIPQPDKSLKRLGQGGGGIGWEETAGSVS